MRKLGQLSNRVKKNRGNDLAPERYQWLSLENAEPDFGVPSVDQSILSSDTDGTRRFLVADAGLTINELGFIRGEETTFPINTTGYKYSDSTNLRDVLTDLNTNTTSDNTPNTLVFRDNNGGFSAGKIIATNLETQGYLRGPATFIIDPAAYGDETGVVQILGDLVVDGVTTSINSTVLEVEDINIVIAKGTDEASTADGAGITIDLGTSGTATILYGALNDDITFNKDVVVPNLTVDEISSPVLTGDGSLTSAITDYETITGTGTTTSSISDFQLLTGTADADSEISAYNLITGTGSLTSAISQYEFISGTATNTSSITDYNLITGTSSATSTISGFEFITGTGTENSVISGFQEINALNSISSSIFVSTVANGTAPFQVVSSTRVANLNADLLDNIHASQFLRNDQSDNYLFGTFTFDPNTSVVFADTATVNFNNATGTAPFSVVSDTKVDNLNADLIDGLNSAQFLRSDDTDSYTFGTLTFSSGTTLTLSSGANVNFNNAQGISPFSVQSSTLVTNLNADKLDGLDKDDFLRSNVDDSFVSGTLTFSTGTFLTLADGATLTFNNQEGSAPFDVTSSTLVTNLNANYLDGVTKGELNLQYVTDNSSVTTNDIEAPSITTTEIFTKNSGEPIPALYMGKEGDVVIGYAETSTGIYIGQSNVNNTTNTYFYGDINYQSTQANYAGGSITFSIGANSETPTVDFANAEVTNLTIDGLIVSGTFTGDLTGNLTGNADTATALETARSIAGVSFDGTADIDIPVDNLSDISITSASEANILIYDNVDSQWKNFSISGDVVIAKDGTATIQPDSVTLGTDTTGSYVASAQTSGNGLSGAVDEESGVFTVTSNATSDNTGNTIVFRDGNGDFSAGVITASLTGNADTATTLETARNIAGVSFDGSASIDIPVENLSNVTINTAADGHFVIYDTDDSQWKNFAISGDVVIDKTGVATIQENSVALGTDTTGSYVASAGTTGNGISGSVDEESGVFTVTSNATEENTASTLVFRDANGDFSAGIITADLTGNADTATTLETARTIAGVSFDGSANIDIPVTNLSDVTVDTPVDAHFLIYDANDSQWKNFAISGDVVIAKDGTATIQENSVALGTDTTGSYVASAGTSGNGISGSVDEESGVFTVTSNAVSTNTASTLVFRDASGDFSAGNITASLTGNASTATILQNSRTIAGVSFNGSQNIDIPVANLSDVTVDTAQNAHILIYDEADSQWKNFAISGDIVIDKTGVATIQANSIVLGTDTTGSYVESATTSGNGLSGSVDEESGVFTVTSNATEGNTPDTIVYRDASGNFSANSITADLVGNADTATKLETARNIAGISFDGSDNVDIPLGNLDNVTLASLDDGHFIVYDTVDLQWKNFAISGAIVIDKTGVATIQPDSVVLGTDTTGSYVASGATSGNGLSGSVDAESGVFTVTSNAVSTNTASTLVFRDASGDFAAGTITFNNLFDGTITIEGFVDEDTMASNSAVLVPTQQSVKTYVDNEIDSIELSFNGDEGAGALSVNLVSDALAVIGTLNQITTSGSGNQIQIGLPDNVIIEQDLTVKGDLTVNGTSVTINTSNLTVSDPIIHLAGDNISSDTSDSGFITHYSPDAGVTILHAGVVRDASDGKFKFFDQLVQTGLDDDPPDTDINFGDATISTVVANLEGDVTGNADTATTLETARTIAGVSFNGSANIDIPIANLNNVTIDSVASADFLIYDAVDSQWKNFDISGDVVISKTGVATIQANSVELGTDTTGSYVASGATSGNGLSGSVDEESGVFTVTSNAVSANTANTLVFRDASGNFSAGTITAELTGNADTATTLETPRNIAGISFDGSDNVDIPLGNLDNVTITSVDDAHFIIYDTVDVEWKNFAVSGDIVIDKTGVATIQPNAVTLGTDTTGSYVASGATSGNGLSGSVDQESGVFTVTSNAESSNTVNTLVFRDASGNFSAGTITATLSGNADSATILANARTIAGVSFNGSQNIDIPVENLSNVTVNSAADGHFVIYDTADSQWKNFAISGDVVIAKDGTATIQANSVALGTDTTGSYVASASTSGNGLSGSVNEESGVFTVTSNAVSANTASTLVFRDASGNFSAGTITAALTGNASTATTLQTARTIAGVSFNGSANIDIPVANLSDITVANLADSNFLIYDTADSQWKNFSVSGDVVIAKDGTATIQANSVELGTDTTGSYVASGATSGNGISGSVDEESGVFTVTSNAVSTNTASTLVYRDASGDFSAGTITATLTGNADTATTLETARNIAGVSFDGSANIDIPVQNLSNVTVTTAGDGHFFIYDTADSQWKNFAISGDVVIGKDGTATIQANSVELGTDTTGSYVASGATSGNGLSGSVDEESGVFTVTSNAVSTNTASTLVYRDASGDFSAGTITATLSGNADTATTLATARNIAGVSFDGSANIDIPVENLSNVTVTNAGDGHFVIYDTTDSQWKNFAVSGDVVISKDGTATIQANAVTLGTDTTGSYVASASTSGNGISGSVDEESGVFTVTSNAVSTNTASTLVFRDATGNFSAGTITANLTGDVTGNADTATTLETTRTIAGVSFNGSQNVAIPIQNLSNVSIDTASSGNFIVYDADTSQWRNVSVSGDITISKDGTATIQENSVVLGTDTTGSYVASGTTSGNGLSGSVDAESGVFTVTSNAVSANTANTLVYRNASGSFSAGTITASLSGNATTATSLATAREIAGVSFDGSADIAIPLANLSDVTVTSATDADLLFYDTADSKWKNFSVSGDVVIDKSGVATIQPDSVVLGTDTTGSYVASGATSGNGISGSIDQEAGVFTVISNATSANTEETIVYRDVNGDFSAGTITTDNLVTTGYLRGPSLFLIDPVGYGDGTGTVEVDGSLSVTSNLIIDGNLVVSGTTFTIDSTTLNVDSNIIYLNKPKEINITNAVGDGSFVTYTTDGDHEFIAGQTVDILGIIPNSLNINNAIIDSVTNNTVTVASTVIDAYSTGGQIRSDITSNIDLVVVGAYDDGTYAHSGVFRDASDGTWKFFDGYLPEPNLQPFLDTTDPSFSYANLRADNIRGSTFTSDVATGTAPFTVSSTTLVTNLNADLLDGVQGSAYLRSNQNDQYTTGTLTFNSGTTLTAASGATVNFNNAQGTAPFAVVSTTKVTNLNADLLDGLTSADFTLDRVTDNGNTTTNNISVGQVTTTGILVDSNVELTTATHSATTVAAEVIATFDGSQYSSAKFVVQAKDSSGNVQVSEVLLAHDTVTSTISEYSIVHTSADPIASYTTDIDTGVIRLLAVSSTANTDFNVSMTLLA